MEMHYNLLVIGSGSGGMATARRAAYHAKNLGKNLRIGVIERDVTNLMGGTCVSRGCVPKKVMWSAATLADSFNHVSEHYGFRFESGLPKLDFASLVKNREIYTARLRKIYEDNLKNSGIELIRGFAKFPNEDMKTLNVVRDDGSESQYTSEHLVIACGGKSQFPSTLEGAHEHCIDSDGFFRLTKLPESVTVIGAGYIAVELAGVLNSLGSKTTLCVRGERPLRAFDSMLSEELMVQMKQSGITIETNFVPRRVYEKNGKKIVEAASSDRRVESDIVIVATGRTSREYLDGMNLPDYMCSPDRNHLVVDEYQNTHADGVYAVGDVIGKAELTPVAIAAGRRLADRLFGGLADAKISYDNIPTVIFSHPPIGTIGLSEVEARSKYEGKQIRVYNSSFVNSLYGILPVDGPPKPRTRMKLVCVGEEERIVGLHVIGDGADEMLQGFGVAVKMNATKSDFDNCIAIHPTAAEELVTLAPWGLK